VCSFWPWSDSYDYHGLTYFDPSCSHCENVYSLSETETHKSESGTLYGNGILT
jgi:hypothetical protein